MKNVDFSVVEANLISREQATSLVKELLSLYRSKVTVDFSKVSFVSRSFADQFVKEIELARKTLAIELAGLNKDVLSIMDAVSKTKHLFLNERSRFNVEILSSTSSLSNYLYSVDYELNVIKIFEDLNKKLAELNPETRQDFLEFNRYHETVKEVQLKITELGKSTLAISSNRVG